MNDNEIRRNGSGYYDPTAYEAIKNTEIKERSFDKSDEKFYKLLNSIFDICELAGFHVENRIVLKEKETGKIWR